MELAKNWRLKAARYRLEGQRNTQTGEVRFPAQPLAEAEAAERQPFALSGRGEVFSFTVQRQVPEGFESYTPLTLALVRLAEGPLVTAQLTDVDEADIAIGMPVEMVTRKLREVAADGLLVYGYKFRPQL